MAAKLTRLTHEIATQVHLVAESCTIYSYRSRRPVPKLLDTPSYFHTKLIFKTVCHRETNVRNNTYSRPMFREINERFRDLRKVIKRRPESGAMFTTLYKTLHFELGCPKILYALH